MTTISKETLVGLLKAEIVKIHFTKVSGESRTCKATLISEYLPESTSANTKLKNVDNPEVIKFYSIEDGGWRSCRVELITNYEII